jgi:signal transduction histidine kinase
MTAFSFNPLRWPLAIKVPAFVALFMLGVSVLITNAVLSRLKETQERHLTTVSGVYLDGLSSAVLPHVLRDDVWEVFDTVDRNTGLGDAFGKVSVVVVNARGETIASSDPTSSPVSSLQNERDNRFGTSNNLIVNEAASRAHGRRALVYQERVVGRIFADFDISHLLKERSDVLRTLIVTNALIALFLTALGYWVIRRMLTPLGILSRHLDRVTSGPVEVISLAEAGTPGGEFARLFTRFNTLASALNEREVIARQLASEERLASLGRLASGMAHEINNPLGGIFNAIDTVKRHGDNAAIRRSSLDLIERGLHGIRDVVRSTLATYRADRDQRNLTVADLDDLKLLVSPEANRLGIILLWHNHADGDIRLPSSTVRQILLNLVLNAAQASPRGSTVMVVMQCLFGALVLTVEDEGPGLPEEAEAVLIGAANKPLSFGEGTGLGLWMTRRLVTDLGGSIVAEQRPRGGSSICVKLPQPNPEELRHVA